MMTEPDWEHLLETAVLYDEFMRTGNIRIAAEIRIRTGLLSATSGDRARIGLTVGAHIDSPLKPPGADGAGATVTQMDDERRKRVLGQGSETTGPESGALDG
jgi:hypothetical protein